MGGFYSFGVFVVPFTEAFDVGRGRAAAVGSCMPVERDNCGAHSLIGTIALSIINTGAQILIATSPPAFFANLYTKRAFGFLASAPFAGRLGDRVGNRRVVALGALVAAAGLVLGSLAGSIWAMMASYGATLGLGSSMLYVCAAATIGHWFERRLGLAMGLAIAGGGLGNIIFPPLIKLVMDAHGWRWSLRMLAGCYVAVGLAATALIERRVPVPPPARRADSAEHFFG